MATIFPVSSAVVWGHNFYRVTEVDRRSDGQTWALLAPIDPDLRAKWAPTFELKPWYPAARDIEPPTLERAEEEFLKRTAGEAVGLTESRQLVIEILAAQGIAILPFEVTPRALEIAEEFAGSNWRDGVNAMEESS